MTTYHEVTYYDKKAKKLETNTIDSNEIPKEGKEPILNKICRLLNIPPKSVKGVRTFEDIGHKEALEMAKKIRWKVGVCSQGESCWCRTITPIEPIIFPDGHKFHICGAGQIDKDIAQYLVEVHNDSLTP